MPLYFDQKYFTVSQTILVVLCTLLQMKFTVFQLILLLHLAWDTPRDSWVGYSLQSYYSHLRHVTYSSSQNSVKQPKLFYNSVKQPK